MNLQHAHPISYVLLVDIGPLDLFDAAERDAAAQPGGTCVWFALPDPLWYEYQALTTSP
jgi:hypothetical protein